MRRYRFILRVFFGVFAVMAVIFFYYTDRKEQRGYEIVIQQSCKGVLEKMIVEGRNTDFIVDGKKITFWWAGRLLETEAVVGDSLIKYSGEETVELVKMNKDGTVALRKSYDLR